ncbi:MAG: Gfo/Idh/MocA family oxidoreductase [Pirellulales bacterium]
MGRLSRREFLDQSMLAAAAASLATLPQATLPQSTRADEADAGKRVSPNEKVRVAVIGVNGQGGAHLAEWLRNPGVELVAVCDCDPAAYGRREGAFKNLKQKPAYVQDVRKLLEDKSIDAVSIATPNHWHALMAIWAMQAGKDVYVEKPCSHTVQEGRVMTQWARKLGRMCQMGVQSRSMSGMRDTLAFVHSGKLGKIHTARAICYRRRDSIGKTGAEAPIPEGLDFNLWCGPAPLVVPKRKRLHYDWHWFYATGGGDITNQNPHELDKARWGLGKQELPKRVVSLGGRLGYLDDAEVANCQVTVYQWDDALLISDVRGLPIKSPITFGLQHKGFNGALNVWYGTEGYALGLGYTAGVAYDYDGKELGKWSGGEYQDHFANFLKAVRSRQHTDLHLDIEDAHLSSALAHLGNVSLLRGSVVAPGTRPENVVDDKHVADTFASLESYLGEQTINYQETPIKLGKPLVIDPKTELSDDPESNKLFQREYRQGFELPT